MSSKGFAENFSSLDSKTMFAHLRKLCQAMGVDPTLGDKQISEQNVCSDKSAMVALYEKLLKRSLSLSGLQDFDGDAEREMSRLVAERIGCDVFDKASCEAIERAIYLKCEEEQARRPGYSPAEIAGGLSSPTWGECTVAAGIVAGTTYGGTALASHMIAPTGLSAIGVKLGLVSAPALWPYTVASAAVGVVLAWLYLDHGPDYNRIVPFVALSIEAKVHQAEALAQTA